MMRMVMPDFLRWNDSPDGRVEQRLDNLVNEASED